ncbi:MAG: hypothetical protein LAQ30_23580 [Acidobacteriia bacterium]|nr:hypothetical protein [Terriglobia bacterium]
MFQVTRSAGLLSALALTLAPSLCRAQQTPPAPGQADRAVLQEGTPGPAHKRIFWIIPNYRTYPSLADYKPITAREKFKIAFDDAFDRGTFVEAALFAGEGQLTKATPTFGQGVAGYSRYLGASFADFAIGDYMTEAIYPAVLHQDPRYFRRGTGSGWSRLKYSVGQIFWTRSDSGKGQFNYSEVAGNATASAISCAYYPDNRDAASAGGKLAIQIGLDTMGNILKEFWPDVARKIAPKAQK